MIPMIDWEDRAKTAEAELERVRVERDEWHNRFDIMADENSDLNADLDKALAALRKIEEADPGPMSHTLGVFRDIARAAIAEIVNGND